MRVRTSMTIASFDNEKNLQESTIPRRSSRRATIERRVWVIPRNNTSSKFNNVSKKTKIKKLVESTAKKEKLNNILNNQIIGNRIKKKIKSKTNKDKLNSHDFSGSKIGTYNVVELENHNKDIVNKNYENTEGTLLSNNESCSLQDIVVEEVIKDHASLSTSTNEIFNDKIIDRDDYKSKFDSNALESHDVNSVNILENNKVYKNKISKKKILSITTFNDSEELIKSDTSVPQINDNITNDDNHVSLSEALAKLVDSNDSVEGVANEIVTIHSVQSTVESDNNQLISKTEDIMNTNNNPELSEKVVSQILKEGLENKLMTKGNKDDCSHCHKIEFSKNLEDHFSEDACESGLSHLKNSQLLKTIAKPPVIKTPLKCSECQMRFCTVRSLFWHFGTHEMKTRTSNGEILLKNLVTTWDKPQEPIHLKLGEKIDYFGEDEQDAKSEESSVQKDEGSIVNGEFILKVPVPKFYHRKNDDDDDHICQSNKNEVPSEFKENKYASSLYKILTNKSCKIGTNAKSELQLQPFANKSESLANANSYLTLLNDIKSLPNQSNCFYSDKISEPLKNYDHLESVPSAVPSTNFTKISNSSLNSVSITSYNGSLEKGFKNPTAVFPTEGVKEYFGKSNIPVSYNNENKLVEKDGLVMINKNLALRILSNGVNEISFQSPELNMDDSYVQNSANILTICPQNKNIEQHSGKLSEGLTPDILTIVPQTNSSKFTKDNIPDSSPQLITASGKVTPDPSQVVKLVLLPPNLSKSKKNKVYSTIKGDSETAPSIVEGKEESDDSEAGMVIDVKEDCEECSMDPLSLCTVTMDDETNRNSPENRILNIPTLCANNNKDSYETAKKYKVKVDDEKYQQRKYVCQFCQKRFGWSTDLKRHVILHTGERPFKCKWCPITFTRKFLLQNHMKKIHAQICKWSDLWE